ncbi:hypothetical protein SY88_11630 [Clostridiales bacterium PH28_bin88]|nr:hypothetical protein SY88_11630 [Clostridiales bacterium PH28_bin88]
MDREKITAIKALKKTLKDLGYYQFQINALIADLVGTTDVSRCAPEQLDQVLAVLEEQIVFARQCMNSPDN